MRNLLIATLAIIVIAASAVAYWYVAHRFNPREVVPGVYRAGQPTPRDLDRAADELGIRTVLNLRGPNQNEVWYQREKAAASRLGLRQIDFRMQSFDWPPRPEVVAFTQSLLTSQRPILMHCESGVDRSGWAAGVARLLHGAPLEAAREELAPSTGHICDRATCGLHLFFDEYAAWLGRTREAHSADTFRGWILDDYYPPPYRAGIAMLSEFPSRTDAGAEIAMRVRVTNLSHVPWTMTREGNRGIRLGARVVGPFRQAETDALPMFRKPNGPARDLGRAHADDAAVPPGGARELDLVVRAPEEPGHYVIHVDMVDEGVHWFSDVGSSGVLLPVVVQETNEDVR